jgi:NTE family protein
MLSKFKNILFFVLFSSAFITAQSRTVIRLERAEKKMPFGLSDQIPLHFPKIGLALSGGGARSISQIGVLKAFEEEKIPLDMILGTSMGSIVGGLYSAGYSIPQLDSILRSTDWPSFFSPKQSGQK